MAKKKRMAFPGTGRTEKGRASSELEKGQPPSPETKWHVSCSKSLVAS